VHLKPTVTEVAHNFSDYINRVAYRRESFTLMRSGKPVAELGPPLAGRKLGELPSLLESLPRLGAKEAEALDRDIESARELLRQQEMRDLWES